MAHAPGVACIALFGILGLVGRASASPPVVFRVSEGVAPGGTVSLYGADLTGAVKVKFIEAGNTVVDPIQTDPDGQFARVQAPDVAPGVYSMVASSDGGTTWGKPALLNVPDPRWLSEEQGYPGLEMKLMGRNLDAREYGGQGKTGIQFVARDGGAVRPIAPTRFSPYCVTFVLPGDLPMGRYFVEVRTRSGGLGDRFVRLRDEERRESLLEVVARPADPLARALGVAWASAFSWSHTFDVRKDFGASGGGSADDTAAIQKAIDLAAAQGGGVVDLAAGTYKIQGLNLNRGVILKGAGTDTTVLKFFVANPKRDGTEYMIFQAQGAGERERRIGIANLTVTIDPSLPRSVPIRVVNFGNLSSLTARHIFLYGNRFDLPLDAPKWRGLYINADAHVLIAKNLWRGNSPAWSHGIKRYLVCRDNTFDYANDQVSLSSDRMLFENNTLTGHIVPGVTTNLHGLFTESWVGYNAWNRYIAHNTVRNVNFVPGNDGEAFALDSPGFYLFGDVRESGIEQTVIAEESLARSGSIGWNQEWQALVIKGRGMGQLRKVTGHAEQPGKTPVHWINVSPPWDVPPDRTSKIAIVRTQTGVVFEDNTATDSCAGATQLYFCCYDCVAAGTVAERTLGVINYGVYVKNPVTPTHDRTAFMSFFTKVRGCRVSGASARFKNTWIGDRGEDGLASARVSPRAFTARSSARTPWTAQVARRSATTTDETPRGSVSRFRTARPRAGVSWARSSRTTSFETASTATRSTRRAAWES